jgi:hypothetical protein
MRAWMLERTLDSLQNRRRQVGQIAPVALFGILIASAALVLMYNTGQKITEKSNVTNAADAAAYSGAVWTARHLNFLAYSNRAMVANHIAVGHYVSYTSWLRYVHESIEEVDRVAQWIPYVGQYVDAVEEIIQEVREANDDIASEVVEGIDRLNGGYRAAQVETQASLALNHLNDLMRATARAYDPDINVNEKGDLDAMPSALRAPIQAQLLSQLSAVPTFVQRYTASNDRGSLNEVITSSLSTTDNNNRWIAGRRGWSDTRLIREVRKDGSTTHTQNDRNADWRASDRLRYRVRQLFGWGDWHSLGGTQRASARELYRNYAGVPNYYNLRGNPGDQSLRIGVLATKSQTRVATAQLLGMQSAREPIAAAAMARVEFRRPNGAAFASLAGSRVEYSNLFNPFWDAHLTAADLGLGF